MKNKIIILLFATLFLVSCWVNVSEKNWDNVKVWINEVEVKSWVNTVKVWNDWVDVNVLWKDVLEKNLETDDSKNEWIDSTNVDTDTNSNWADVNILSDGVKIDNNWIDLNNWWTKVKMDSSWININVK